MGATIAAILWQTVAYADSPYLRTANPVKDELGRTQVIVDFVPSASKASDQGKYHKSQSVTPGHRPETVALVSDFERRYGFTKTGMTSWVGASVTAFLTTQQIESIRADTEVEKVSDVSPVYESAQPPWGNTTYGNETQSWGRNAIGGQVATGSARRVYVVDSGVAAHDDLNLVAQVSVSCGSGVDCGNATDDAYVGCYAHATHVAGIIGAKVDSNNVTTAGVYANVGIYSVSLTTKYFAPGDCGNMLSTGYASSTDRVGYALDYIYRDVLQNGGGLVAIVNMSVNPGGVGFEPSGSTWVSQANYNKVIALTTPASGVYDPSTGTYRNYPGAVFVQSAGNDDMQVCDSAYASRAFTPYAWFVPGSFPPNYTANASDGVLVVGALHHTGDTVNSGISGYPALPFSATYPSGLSGAPSPSNFGACVDVWAPGNAIVSTWGDHASPNTVYRGTAYSGNPVGGSSGWAFLSGTSMAAPHIAGVAAYLADAQSLTTPAAIETAVRAKLAQIKSSDSSTPSAFYDPSGLTYVKDRAGIFVKTPQLP